MTQSTDEAAVEPLDWLAICREYEQQALTSWPGVSAPHYALSGAFKALADEIVTLRAQLTAATRRAEQAERMLAERNAALHLTRESLCKVEGMLEAGINSASAARRGLRIKTLAKAMMDSITTIRSAASGEQG